MNGLGAKVMDEFLSGISALAVVAFAVWFCWDGGSAWNDEKYVFLAQSKNCNAVGICDLDGPENLISFKISVSKATGSVIFLIRQVVSLEKKRIESLLTKTTSVALCGEMKWQMIGS
jgi:hypothetical protein